MGKWLLVLAVAAVLFGLARVAGRGMGPSGAVSSPTGGRALPIEPDRAVHATILLLASLLIAYETV